MSEPSYSYQVRIVVHDPRGKWYAPTNTTVEFVVCDAVNTEILKDIADKTLPGLLVTVESERLDK
jgi:hypothetical protein